MTDTLWYLFCIALAEAPPSLPGLTVFSHGDLHAVVRAVQPDEFEGLVPEADGAVPPRLADLLREHNQVVQAVFAAAAVLPMRFGTAVHSADDMQAYLSLHADAIGQQLSRLRGHAEWGVKWRRQPTAEPSPRPADPSGRGYLRRRHQQLHDERAAGRLHQDRVERLHRQLAALAAAVRPDEGTAGGMETGCAYLIPFDRQEQFVSTVQADDSGSVRLTGPWPPYSFCEPLS